MSLGGLSVLQFLLGLGLLGAVLALLQILRVRHKEVPVATTLFWRQAIEETRARVFRHRFRHLAAWLFFLLIGSLLWLGFAEPRWAGGGAGRTVCLLDASAAMARGTRFADATTRLEADVEGLPAGSTQVLAVGGPTQALLQAGEDRLLLSRRLAGLGPVRAPSRMAEVIQALAQEGSEPLTVRVYGNAAVPTGAGLAEHVTVLRATRLDKTPETAWGLTALGQAKATSGRNDAVDLLVELRGDPLTRAPTIVLAADGGILDARPKRSSDQAGHVRLRFTDLRADGRTVRVRRDDDVKPLGTLVLAAHPVLRVAVPAALRPLFGRVIEADPGLVLAGERADVAIVEGPGSGEVPSLSIVAAQDAAHAIAVSDPGLDAPRLLATVQEDLSLAEIDGAALAQATGRVISIGASTGNRRGITMWRALLAPDAGLVASRAFPLFVAKALRWLADEPPLHPCVAAGEPLPDASARAYGDEHGRSYDPAGAAFTPPVAGAYVGARGMRLSAALLDASPYEAPAVAPTEAPDAPTAPFSPVTLLVLLVFALLGLEWLLFRTGRLP